MVLLISLKSLYNYILINSNLFLVSFLSYYMFTHYKYFAFFILLFRNYFIINFIDYATKYKKNIAHKQVTAGNSINTNHYLSLENHASHLQVVLLETVQIYIVHNYLSINENYLFDITTFIPISFLFEVVFDFFHYWVHRICHVNNFLYKHVHKKHHKYCNLTSIITFYQTPYDFILSVTIPEMITLYIIQSLFFRLSLFQFILIINYKLFSEIAGHSGKYTNSCGFVQFIWLPKILNIDLRTEDHDLHHKLLTCNYSKRFIIWDKLFNTYTKPIET